MKKRTISAGTPGAGTLMVIFAVLCLAVFSALALSSSMAGKRLADASIRATQESYAADCTAEERLAQLREEGEDGEYSYSVPISETRSLEVTVKISGDSYEILRWQTEYTAPWQADDSLGVWPG